MNYPTIAQIQGTIQDNLHHIVPLKMGYPSGNICMNSLTGFVYIDSSFEVRVGNTDKQGYDVALALGGLAANMALAVADINYRVSLLEHQVFQSCGELDVPKKGTKRWEVRLLHHIWDRETDATFDTNEMAFYGHNWEPVWVDDEPYLQQLMKGDTLLFGDCIIVSRPFVFS